MKDLEDALDGGKRYFCLLHGGDLLVSLCPICGDGDSVSALSGGYEDVDDDGASERPRDAANDTASQEDPRDGVVNLNDEREARKPDGSWMNPFPGKNVVAFTDALKTLGISFRFNTRALRIEHLTDGAWQPLTDIVSDFTQETVAARFWVKVERGNRPLHFGRESWSRCLNAYLHNDRSVDPFKEYLEQLPDWDGRHRLDHYLTDLFGCDNGDLEIWTARFLFVGAIQRTYQPACLMREMPVLIGDQTIGKSTLTRLILPPDIPGLHSDRLRWDAFAGQQVDAVRGKVVVEVSEMAGRSRAEIEHIKSFISCVDDDGVRLPYRKNPDPMPRRFILCGTTNKSDDLPNDPSGLSRFVPIICRRGSNVEKYMATNRVQLWAEALHRYRGGLRANLPREQMPQQAERAEEHRSRDEFVEDRIHLLPRLPMTVGQLRDELGDSFKDYSAQRIGNAVFAAGWEKRKTGPKERRVWKWNPPEDPE